MIGLVLVLSVSCAAERDESTVILFRLPGQPSFDGCAAHGTARILATDGSVGALVSGDTTPRLCIFDVESGDALPTPRLDSNVFIQNLGFSDSLIWVADAWTRRLLYFSARTAEPRGSQLIPSLEPGLLPIPYRAGRNGGVVVVHWPTDPTGDTLLAIVTTLGDDGLYEVVDSLLVVGATALARSSEVDAIIKIKVPWTRADLLGTSSLETVVVRQMLPDSEMRTTVDTRGLDGGRVRTQKRSFARTMIHPQAVSQWVAEILDDSLAKFLGGRAPARASLLRLASEAKELPRFARVFPLGNARLLLQRNWPDLGTWELRSEALELLSTVALGDSVQVLAVAADRMWGVKYSPTGRPSLVVRRINEPAPVGGRGTP